MTVAGKDVLKTRVEDWTLKLDWLNSEWEKWLELHNSSQFKEIVESINESLSKAKKYHSKGTGKGNSNQ